MCEFISAVKKGGGIYFLTGSQVFDSPRGKALREWCQSPDDYIGHGAIRWYYDLEQKDGKNVEYTDFSSPKNFPAVIARAIKCGDMRGLGTNVDLLVQTAFWDLFATPENRAEAWR